MKLKVLRCPSCGASLKIEEELDTFFCKYCGCQIVLEGQSKDAYKAKVRIKEMEHKEKIQDKNNEQEKFRMEFKQKNERHTAIAGLCVWVGIMALLIIGMMAGEAGAKKQDRELQATVDQIMVDIKNEDFSDAYIKANTLYWNDSWSSEGKEKWNATRKEVIRQIKEAEKKAKGSSNHVENNDDDENEKPFWKFWE